MPTYPPGRDRKKQKSLYVLPSKWALLLRLAHSRKMPLSELANNLFDAELAKAREAGEINF